MNKVAIVTGGANGIGKEISLELVKTGYFVVVADVDSINGNIVAEKLNHFGKAIFIETDVSNEKNVNSLIEKTLFKFERIDVLVNNAGILLDSTIAKTSTYIWQKVIDINLTGSFNCIKAVIPSMRASGCGKIICISSVVGQTGNFGQANYCASKAGLIALTKTVAIEEAKYNILSNCICPSLISGGIAKDVPEKFLKEFSNRTALKRIGVPADVANMVNFLVSNKANFITGAVFNVDGGFK